MITLYPSSKRGECTMILLANLTEAEFVNVNCSEKLLTKVYCLECSFEKHLEENFWTHIDLQLQNLNKSCPLTHLEINNNCLKLKRCSSALMRDISQQQVKCNSVFLNSTKIAEAVSILLGAMSLSKLSVFIPPKQNSSNFLITTTKLINVINFQHKVFSALKQHTYGYFVCASKKVEITPSLNLFHCSKGSFVSMMFVCDGQSDCPNDNSDEVNCVCNLKVTKPKCRIVILNDGSKSCGPMYHESKQRSCEKYLKPTETPKSNISEEKFSNCMDGDQIPQKFLNDLVADCEDQTDELQLMSLLQNDSKVVCVCPDQFPCKPGHSKCYDYKDICVYKLNTNKFLLPCRNGGHLQHCAPFQCRSRFKCLDAYCIEWSDVCDGKQDCPMGDDENAKGLCRVPSFCENMFKCEKTSLCIHLNSICDRNKDCPLADDEMLCELQHVLCPQDCDCLTFALACQKSLSLSKTHFPFFFVQIQFSPLNNWQALFKIFPNVVTFNLHNNNISQVCTQNLPHSLTTVDVAFNLITKITTGCFSSPQKVNLQSLNLEYNHITFLESGSFQQLIKLKALKLSHNPLEYFPKDAFVNLVSLQTLEIKNISLKTVHPLAFKNVSGSKTLYIFTNNTHICCIAPSKSVCSSPPPWHVSCSRLLADTVLLLLYIILSCLIFCLNAASIVVQTCFGQSSSAYAHTVRAINLTDMFLSVYLVIIWIANLQFGETFFLAEKVWKSSTMCFIASFIILYFTFLIQYLLLFLSCARLMVVVKPVNSKFKRKSFTLKCIAVLCVLSFLGSVGFCMIFAFVQKHLPTDLCLPFVDPLAAHVTVVLTYFVTTSQFLVAAIIFVFHSLLAYHVQQSHKKVVATTQHTNLDPTMSFQLVLITLTNVICWYPTNIVFLLAMAWNQYPVKMVVWTTVVSTPINSLLNPGIFIIFCV